MDTTRIACLELAISLKADGDGADDIVAAATTFYDFLNVPAARWQPGTSSSIPVKVGELIADGQTHTATLGNPGDPSAAPVAQAAPVAASPAPAAPQVATTDAPPSAASPAAVGATAGDAATTVAPAAA